MTQETYRVGIVGCGRIGSGLDDPWFDANVRDENWRLRPCTHAGIFDGHTKTLLVAGAEPNPARRRAFSSRWRAQSYENYHDMLREAKLDIVSVATHAPLHAEVTIAAAQTKGVKAILCEKPIACSLEEAQRMIEVCDAYNVKLVINHTMRLNPLFHYVKSQLDAGEIGALQLMVCHFDRWLIHMGSHLFDLMCYFAGQPSKVFGDIRGDATVDTCASGYISYPDGVRAIFDVGVKHNRTMLDLLGTEGGFCIYPDLEHIDVWKPSSSIERSAQTLEPYPIKAADIAFEDHIPRQGRYITSYTVDEVIACIEEGRESVSSGQDARLALEVALAIYQSHNNGGCLVSIPMNDLSLYMPEARPFE